MWKAAWPILGILSVLADGDELLAGAPFPHPLNREGEGDWRALGEDCIGIGLRT